VPFTDDPRIRRVADQFKDRDLQLFMLSTNLPSIYLTRRRTGQAWA
jgi:hypothetical protein